MPELYDVNSASTLYNCSFKNIHFPKLRNITIRSVGHHGLYFMSSCNTIETLRFDELVRVDHINDSCSWYIVGYMNDLKYLYFDKLTFFPTYNRGGYSAMWISNMNKLCTLGMPQFYSYYPNDSGFLSSCPNLLKIILYNGYTNPLYLIGWYPSYVLLYGIEYHDLIENMDICSNNLQQFLYNFREYIVKRLAIKSTKTYIYLHSTTKSYIEGDYSKSWIVQGETQTYYESLNEELVNRNWGLA